MLMRPTKAYLDRKRGRLGCRRSRFSRRLYFPYRRSLFVQGVSDWGTLARDLGRLMLEDMFS